MNRDQLACLLLGIPDSNDHRRILGIPKDRFDHMSIETALRRRIAQLYAHPSGRTKEAQEIRKYLQHIANDLKLKTKDKIGVDVGPQAELTPLDQSIIAVLIGEGGWNRQSRSRLVSVAASYQITVGGLMRILQAFAEASRTGDGPLSRKNRKASPISREWSTLPKKQNEKNLVDDFLLQTAKKLTPDLNTPSPVMTIKIAVLFGLLTTLAFILSLNVLLSPDEPTPEIVDDISLNDNSNFFNNQTEQHDQIFLSPFETYPTFSIPSLDKDLINASDQLLPLIKQIEIFTTEMKDMFLQGQQPNPVWNQSWELLIDKASIGWAYIDLQTTEYLHSTIINFIVESERDLTYTKQLFEYLRPNQIDNSDPLSVSRRTWKSGVLAILKCNASLSAEVRGEASRTQIPEITTCDNQEAMQATLMLVYPQLLSQTELNSNVLKLWDIWIFSVNALHPEFKTLSYVNVINALINSDVDLSRDSSTRKVLGRIVSETPWNSNEDTKELLLNIYNNNSMTNSDLWVLGFILHQSNKLPWMTKSMVIQPSYSRSEIQTATSKLFEQWPVVEQQREAVWKITMPAGFDAAIIEAWQDAFHSIRTNQRELLPIVKFRKLNEAAAAIWKGRPGKANQALSKFETLSIEMEDVQQQFPTTPDGNWRDKYFKSPRDSGSRIEILDSLLELDATDLKPQDADTLASIALTNQMPALRTNATNIITEQFPYGQNVAIAIVNYLDRSKSNRQIASLVAKLTEASLPPLNDPQWNREARRALVQHAIALYTPKSKELDMASIELAESLTAEVLFVAPTMIPPSGDINAVEALNLLLNAWKSTLQPMYLPKQKEFFSPRGVLQQYISLQLLYFDLLKSEELRWRGIDPSQKKIYSHDAVFSSSSILRQMLKLEEEISNHWDSLFDELLEEHLRRSS